MVNEREDVEARWREAKEWLAAAADPDGLTDTERIRRIMVALDGLESVLSKPLPWNDAGHG